MRDEHFEKEFLKENIIPLLFSKKTGRVFPSARKTLRDQGTSISELQERYESADRDSQEFWSNIGDIITESYNGEPSTSLTNDFEGFIEDLLEIRFQEEFRSNDIKKLDESTDGDDLVSELNTGDNLILDGEDSSEAKVIFVGEKSTREYIQPLQPKKEDFYPPLLIVVDKDNNELHLSGDKDQRNKFVYHVSALDKVGLQDEEPESYEEMDIDPAFIQKLKDHDIFLSDIKISGEMSNISLSVASGEGAIEVEDFVDYDLLLQNKLDILSLSSCDFIYVDQSEDVEFKVNFHRYKRTVDNQEYIKISLEMTDNQESYREDIKNILSGYGIEFYEPYYLPSSYYFNKMITTNSNYRARYFEPMKGIDGEIGVDLLTDNNIVADGGSKIEFDKQKLGEKVYDKLSSAEKVDIELDGRQHRIADIEEYENHRIKLILKSYSDNVEDDHRHFYRVIIPFNARPDKFEKVYNVVLSRINYYELLTSESPEDVVEYIVRASQRQIKYQQRMLVEKEARRSAKIIEDYYSSPEDFREKFNPQQAGYKIEDHLNILLRYLFRDYLPGGGKNEPDGGLRLNGSNYLIDSKQSSSMGEDQYLKGKKDIKNSKYTDLIESNNLVYIVCKELFLHSTQSGSLNISSRQRVSRGEDVGFFFMSVEHIYEIYHLFSENTNILSGNPDLQDRVYNEIKHTIEESQHIEDCDELAKIEDQCIGKIRKVIDSVDYLPEDRRRFF